MAQPRPQIPAYRVSPGAWYPLGATVKPDGVNFAIYSQYAREVYLLLFDDAAGGPTQTIKLESRTRYVWNAFVHGLKAGQLYGYKVHGDYDPSRGMRFNQNKLVLDPYAKAVTGKFRNNDNLLLAYDPSSFEADRSFDSRDNSRIAPKSIVVDDAFDWGPDAPPAIPLE